MRFRDLAPILVVVGPHGSATPVPVLKKLAADIVVMGECEEALVEIAFAGGRSAAIPGTCASDESGIRVFGGPRAAKFVDLAPLSWPDQMVSRHHHHHHRFEAVPVGPGAEVEASRGCPYSCSFCAKENFRNHYRRRTADAVIAEVQTLRERHGVEYVYFIDEIFLPNEALLQGLVGLGIKFGIQTRIDLWKPHALELLGRAGCVSVEAGVESLTPSRPRGARQAMPNSIPLRLETGLSKRGATSRSCRPILSKWPKTMPTSCSNGACECKTSDLGERSGSAVSVSRHAGLPQAVGRTG